MARWMSFGRFEEVVADPEIENQSQGNSCLTLESDITLNIKTKDENLMLEDKEKGLKRYEWGCVMIKWSMMVYPTDGQKLQDKTKNAMRQQLEDLGRTR